MTQRTSIRQLVRLGVVVFFVLCSLVFPSGSSVLWAIWGVLLALDGPRQTFPILIGLSLCAEIAAGLDIGTLSLPAAIGALAVLGGTRFLMLAPWPTHERWQIASVFRAWLVAFGSGVLLSFVAALVYATMHDISFAEGVPAVFHAHNLLSILFVSGGALLILRRIDVPFRYHTPFGS